MSEMKNLQENMGEENEVEKLDQRHLDVALRPSEFDGYVGQEIIKANLNILLEAAKNRASPPEHILLYGPPGLGKTTLAHIIARTLNTNIKISSGPSLTKIGDLAAILTNLSPNDVLFIDEIHRLNKMIEEVLYPAMESGVLDIIIGKGPSARTIQLDLPPFTLVGATTRISLLSAPLRSRFSGGTYRLQFYTDEELSSIIMQSAKVLNTEIDKDSALEIAKRARFTPRIANFYLKRIRDYVEVHNVAVTKEVVKKVLEMLEVDSAGLGQIEREYMNIIENKFAGGPVGLSTLAAALSEDAGTIEEVIEPYLQQLGFVEKTTRGRTITKAGREHLSSN
jgi:Holliday junction DNA helicase RuvB